MNLEQLLNINSNFNKSNDYLDIFTKMADCLLNNYVLVIDNYRYRIGEIEFYLKNKDHEDVFTHCDNEQATNGKFYFHRQNGGCYKGGTYKGMDITFGKEGDDKYYGGILIRSIYKNDDNNNSLIEGPCNVVNKILNQYNCDDVENFVKFANSKINNKNDLEQLSVKKINNSLLYLERDDKLKKFKIYGSPRVGLTLKKYTKDRENYLVNDYRFITENKIKETKKYKNCIIVSMYRNKMTTEDIKNVTSSSSQNITKYIDYYNNTHYEAKNYNGKKLSVKDQCILQKICKRINPKRK